MRFPIPERFAYKHVLLFATAVFVAQVAEGTDLTFALLVFVYICLFSFAFNTAGGITFPSGAWIFFTGFLTCILGLTYKIFLNEPGESNLHAPLTTMAAYCVAMAGMGFAAYICRQIRPPRGLLADMAVGETMKQAAIGCLVFGIASGFFTADAVHQSATLSSAFAQLNRFVQMSIILGTSYQIIKSEGKSSTNWIVWTAGIFVFIFGIISFSKEGMFMAPVTWLVPCIAMRFNFSRKQIIGGFLAGFIMLYYLVPLSQYGRRSRTENGDVSLQAAAAWDYIININETRQLYLESGDVADLGDTPHLFQHSQGIFDRLQMLAFDDAMIEYTDTTETIGLGPSYNSFLNVIPRFIWADKPIFADGNNYGRAIGVIDYNDTSTGISFSPVSDGYHQAGWLGVLLVLPATMLLLFLVADSLSGDVRKAPWGLLFIAIASHMAPEGLLSGAVWTATFGAETVILATLLATYILPRIVLVFTGAERTKVRASPQFVLGGVRSRRTASASEGTQL